MSTSSAVASTSSDHDRTPSEVSDSGTSKDEEIMKVEDDSSDSPNDVAEDHNDLSKEMELEGHNSHLRSGSSSQEKSIVRVPSDALAEGESQGNFRTPGSSSKPFKIEKKVPYKNHEDSKCPKSGKHLTFSKANESQDSEISNEDKGAFEKGKTSEVYGLQANGGAHFCNSEIMHAEITPFSATRKNVGTAGRGHLSEETCEEEIEQMVMHAGDDKQKMASRLASPSVRTRSLSPAAEINGRIKRPTVICDFFTKGWCIKGNSCRFLHLKDDMTNTIPQHKEDVAATTVESDAQFDKRLSNIADRPRLPCFPEPMASSFRSNTSLSSDLSVERIQQQELGERKRLPQFHENFRFSLFQRENSSSQQFALSRNDLGFSSSFKEVGREVLRQNWSADDYGNHVYGSSSPMFRDSLLPEYRTSPSPYMFNDYSLPSCPLESCLSISGPTGSKSHHASNWIGSSLPFSSSSSNASPHGAEKRLESDRQCRTSKLSSLSRSTSLLCGSEPDRSLPSADYNTKISSNDWEPSVPFKPSFFIDPSGISFSGSQYDPLHDRFDSPKIGDMSLKVSFSSVRASSVNTPPQQIYGGLMLSGTVIPECNGDKSSVSSQGGYPENVLDKNCHTPGKDSHTMREEVVATSADVQNVAVCKEDEPSVSTCVQDISISKKLETNCDSRRQNDGCRHSKDLKAGRVKQNNEMDIEDKTDGDALKESKAGRHFRASLVDFVKELLKPTWREGKLSKEAHNRIVKKAVDKVLSTLQPHQVPATMESVKQYLSSSQPKIAKLIEGYVDKYGKS